jgi:cytochrome bd ubiquinol oxidase subunit II
MFETLTHLQLQQYWWFIMSLVGSALVFLLFVQGGQTLIWTLGKTDDERNMVVNSMGRKWEFTFTTLVMFAAGMFASFPLWYSVSLGGAYYAWKIFLICFVLQAVSYEFRRKKGNILGRKTYDAFLLINGILGSFLLGAVVATFFTGSDFIRDEYNLSRWGNPWYGLDILLSVTNVSLGLALLFLSRTLGAMYVTTNIESAPILQRAFKQARINAALFLVFFLFFLGRIFLQDGFAYDPASGAVYLEPHKYLNNYLQMPAALAFLLIGVALVLYGFFRCAFRSSKNAIWFSGIGTVAAVMSLFWVLGYNNTAFYPSHNLQSSLTIENASASHYTLTAMSYISLFTPVVLAYIFFTWRAIDRSKINSEHLSSGGQHHVY